MDPRQRVVKSTSDLLLSPTLHQWLHYSHASPLSHHTRLLFSLFFDFMCSSPSSRCLLLLLLLLLFSPSFLSFSHWVSGFVCLLLLLLLFFFFFFFFLFFLFFFFTRFLGLGSLLLLYSFFFSFFFFLSFFTSHDLFSSLFSLF